MPVSEPVQVVCLGGDRHPPALQATSNRARRWQSRGEGPLSHTGARGEEQGSKGCPGQREGALPVADAAVMGASWLRGNAFSADGHASEVVLGLCTGQKRFAHLKTCISNSCSPLCHPADSPLCIAQPSFPSSEASCNNITRLFPVTIRSSLGASPVVGAQVKW